MMSKIRDIYKLSIKKNLQKHRNLISKCEDFKYFVSVPSSEPYKN